MLSQDFSVHLIVSCDDDGNDHDEEGREGRPMLAHGLRA